MKGDNLRKNASGYSDPTAYQAIMNVDADFELQISYAARCNKLIHMIKDMCDLAGFKVDGRIVLVDQETGKVWR